MSAHEPIRVLVADHDRWTRLTMASMLNEAGFSVAEASNGLAALRIGLRTEPQVVLLRDNLPEVPVIDVLQSLRGDARTRHSAVLQLTDDEDLPSAYLEFDGHLTVPCHPIALLAEVMHALERRGDARNRGRRRQAEVGVPIRSVSAAARGARSVV